MCDTQAALDAALRQRCAEQYAAGADVLETAYDVDMDDLSTKEEYAEYKSLEKVELGDTVHCRHRKLNISADARTVRLVWDCILRKNKKLYIGDYKKDYFARLNDTAQRIQDLRDEMVESEERVSQTVSEASERLDKALKEASGLYCSEKEDGKGGKIILLHDKKTMEESKNVIMLTADAIGFSTDGGKTYPYGFTIDGEFVAKILSAHGINADWIKAGSIDLGVLKLTGTVCGLIQGHGSIPDGSPTDGIVIYGNGVDGAGKPNPPYIIVTNAGVRFQISSSEYVYFSGGYAAYNSENMTVTGNIAAEGDLAVSGKRVARYVLPTNLMTLGTNETRTLVDGTQVYISEDQENFETYIRGDRIYASKDINVISDRRLKKDIEPLPEVYAQVLDGMTPVRFRYKSEPEGGAYHMGYIAQDVAKALAGAGLAPEDMAAVGVRPDDDARMTLAYGELVAMLHLKIRCLERRLDAIQAKRRDGI